MQGKSVQERNTDQLTKKLQKRSPKKGATQKKDKTNTKN